MKRFAILAGVVLAVVLLGVAIVIPTFAEGPTPTPTPKAPFGCHGDHLGGHMEGGSGRGLGFWGGSWADFDAAAKALGLTPEQLFAELRAGKSLAQIAEARGVKLEAVQEAMKAAQIETMKQSIQQAVTDGKLTQAQADWLLKGLELGFMPGRWGFGRGWGKGFHPMGGSLGRGLAPSIVPSQS